MIKEVNNKIVKDVLASFEMDFIEVPNLIVEKAKEKLKCQKNEEKKLVLKNKEKF